LRRASAAEARTAPRPRLLHHRNGLVDGDCFGNFVGDMIEDGLGANLIGKRVVDQLLNSRGRKRDLDLRRPDVDRGLVDNHLIDHRVSDDFVDRRCDHRHRFRRAAPAETTTTRHPQLVHHRRDLVGGRLIDHRHPDNFFDDEIDDGLCDGQLIDNRVGDKLDRNRLVDNRLLDHRVVNQFVNGCDLEGDLRFRRTPPAQKATAPSTRLIRYRNDVIDRWLIDNRIDNRRFEHRLIEYRVSDRFVDGSRREQDLRVRLEASEATTARRTRLFHHRYAVDHRLIDRDCLGKFFGDVIGDGLGACVDTRIDDGRFEHRLIHKRVCDRLVDDDLIDTRVLDGHVDDQFVNH
jgi:hypothetical protein